MNKIKKLNIPDLRGGVNVLFACPFFISQLNGYFKTLKGIVHFYNTRDTKPECPDLYTEAEALAADCWPQPEVSANLNTAEMGDLGLTPEEEDAIVAFLRTLSDGYQP